MQTLRTLFAPADISFLVCFRVLMGLVLLWDVCEFYLFNYGESLATRPFRFTYHGFAWIEPWSTMGMNIHFAVLALFALFIAFGFLYRLSTVAAFLAFSYIFFLEKSDYLNHNYLICLFLFLLIFLPANRCWSVDAWLRPRIKSQVTPAWTLWLLRFQVGLPYFYGGIAKLNADWLRGQPMQMWLSVSPWRVVLGPMAEEHWFALFFSWAGMLFDLLVVPLLLWNRTRAITFCVAVTFHLMNAFMFDIGVFPWMMIGATTVFFPPDWPRRLLDNSSSAKSSSTKRSVTPKSGKKSAALTWDSRRKLVVAGLGLYVVFHLLFPFRHFLYPGNVLWTEEGHRFAWQMMLRTKKTGLQIAVVDRETGKQSVVKIGDWLSTRQINKMARDPEMLREFAQFLRETHEKKGRNVEVHVVALCSLNGRKPQLLVDPRVDLSRQQRSVFPQPWILPLTEPFRWKPWDYTTGDPLDHLRIPKSN